MPRPTILIEFGEFAGTAINMSLEVKDSLEIREERFPPELIVQVGARPLFQERVAGNLKEMG